MAAPARPRVSLQLLPALTVLMAGLILGFALTVDSLELAWLFRLVFFAALGWVLWLLFTARRGQERAR